MPARKDTIFKTTKSPSQVSIVLCMLDSLASPASTPPKSLRQAHATCEFGFFSHPVVALSLPRVCVPVRLTAGLSLELTYRGLREPAWAGWHPVVRRSARLTWNTAASLCVALGSHALLRPTSVPPWSSADVLHAHNHLLSFKGLVTQTKLLQHGDLHTHREGGLRFENVQVCAVLWHASRGTVRRFPRRVSQL